MLNLLKFLSIHLLSFIFIEGAKHLLYFMSFDFNTNNFVMILIIEKKFLDYKKSLLKQYCLRLPLVFNNRKSG